MGWLLPRVGRGVVVDAASPLPLLPGETAARRRKDPPKETNKSVKTTSPLSLSVLLNSFFSCCCALIKVGDALRLRVLACVKLLPFDALLSGCLCYRGWESHSSSPCGPTTYSLPLPPRLLRRPRPILLFRGSSSSSSSFPPFNQKQDMPLSYQIYCLHGKYHSWKMIPPCR